VGRAGARPARQEVRHRHGLARGQQRAAASARHVAALLSSPGAFIAAKGQPFDGPPTLLRNKKIGVQKDTTHADWLDKSFRRSAQIKRYATVTTRSRADRTRSTRCSATRCSSGCGRRSPKGKCCEVMGQDIKDTQTLGVGVSAGLRREDIKLRDAFNKALAR
jgi:ABC-type amino acid transport substrate-binding protein